MKFLDLLRMSSGNLWKRKVRTILTVLGVVIGVASIVVMLSLGLGLKRTMMEQYESYGSLTQITVNQPWNSDNEEEMRLDDELVPCGRPCPCLQSPNTEGTKDISRSMRGRRRLSPR